MDSAKVDEDTQQRINDGDWLCVDSQYVFNIIK